MVKRVKGRAIVGVFYPAIVLALCWADNVDAQLADAQKLQQLTNHGLVEMLTGADDTSVQIAQDLANVINDSATRRIVQVVGRDSMQNLIDLRLLRGVDIAVIESDVLAAVKKQKVSAGPESSITYIAKLYNEELHVLAPVAVQNISDLEGKRVAFVTAGATTGNAIFDLLKIKIQASTDDLVPALHMLKTGQVAALVYVAGRPISMLQALSKQEGVHLLSVPLKPEMVADYFPVRLSVEDYPNLIAADGVINTVAVGAVMVVAGLPAKTERYRNVANFVDAFFTRFPRLQEEGHHAKWQEVNLAAELPGWRRFPPAETWLQRNVVASSSPLKEQELREIFAKFIDERNLLSGGRSLSGPEKAQMFDQFLQWQKTQVR